MAVGQESLARLMQSTAAGQSMVAALCFLVWDVLLTTDQEVCTIDCFASMQFNLLYS